MLLVNGACADMAAQTDAGEVYIGENNQLTLDGAVAPLETALATQVLGASGNIAYYLLLGEALADGTPTYTLMQMDVSVPEATVVAENVLFAVFQPGENGVFYVTEAQPTQIYAGGAFGGCGGGALAGFAGRPGGDCRRNRFALSAGHRHAQCAGNGAGHDVYAVRRWL